MGQYPVTFALLSYQPGESNFWVLLVLIIHAFPIMEFSIALFLLHIPYCILLHMKRVRDWKKILCHTSTMVSTKKAEIVGHFLSFPSQAPDSETSLMPSFFSFTCFRSSGAAQQQLSFWNFTSGSV